MSLKRPRASAGLTMLAAALAACLEGEPAGPRQSPECEPPVFDASEWTPAQGPTFSYRIPQRYQRPEGSARWEWGRVFVHPQPLRQGQLPEAPPVILTDYSECRARIGGHEALIQLGATGNSTRYGLGWYLSATWEAVPIDEDGDPGFVLFEAWTPVNTYILELEAIFFTVSFLQ